MTRQDHAAERLEKQFRFLTEIDRLKRVERQNILADGSRRENSAEHSWHLALLALCLSEHAAAKELDLFKVVKLLLVHDIVEIDAGDAFLHEPAALAAQAAREEVAAERIFVGCPMTHEAVSPNLRHAKRGLGCGEKDQGAFDSRCQARGLGR